MICYARWPDGYQGKAPPGWFLCCRKLGHAGPHLSYLGLPPSGDGIVEPRDAWQTAVDWHGITDADLALKPKKKWRGKK